jgi:hypothetical protein
MKATKGQARSPQGDGPQQMATAFGAEFTGISPTEVFIGQTVGLTGPHGEVARDIVLGTQALVQSVNDAGGIHGRRLRLLTLDDRHEPARIERNLRQLTLGDEVFALLNLTGGARALDALSVPCVGPGAGESSQLQRSMWQVLRAGAGRSADAVAQAWQLWLSYQVDMRRLGAIRVAPASLEAYLNARLMADAMRWCGPNLSRAGLVAALRGAAGGALRPQVAGAEGGRKPLPEVPSLANSPTSFGI